MGLKKYALAVLLLLLPAVALAQIDPISINNTVTVTADNQATVGGEATSTASVTVLPAPPATVPTLSSTGLTALTVLLAGLGVLVMRRRTRWSA